MTVVMDVSYSSFNSFRKKNPVFFWYEDEFSFFLFKPYNDAWLRTVINKRGGSADFLWRDMNLLNQTGAIRVNRVNNLDTGERLSSIFDELKRIRIERSEAVPL